MKSLHTFRTLVPVQGDSTSNTTSTVLSPFTPGNGMVEIATLTTLVGSSTAGILMFGTRGSAGLPWAAMSAFGALSIVRTCISGASPAWLRETLGIRDGMGDSILGLALNLEKDTRGASKLRRGSLEASQDKIEVVSTHEDVYQFSRTILNILDTLPTSSASSPPRIYTCVPSKFTPFQYQSVLFIQPYKLLLGTLSSVKLVELYVIWRLDSLISALVFGLPWAYFFLASLVLHVTSLFQKGGETSLGPMDYLVGRIPLAQREGRERAILLGAHETSQTSVMWRTVWALGAMVEVVSIVLSYTQLNQIGNYTVYVWAMFQLLWLGTRIIFHHFTCNWNECPNRPIMQRRWEDLDAPLKLRILELVVSLAKYQSYVHPRGDYSYRWDLFSSQQLRSLCGLSHRQLTTEHPLNLTEMLGKKIIVDVIAVIGDTLLSSTSWIKGSTYTGMDFYDCCLVSIRIGTETHSIPSVRVLSGKAASAALSHLKDTEIGEQVNFTPKGASNYGWGINWYFWIPCQDGCWIEMISENESMKFLGLREGMVLHERSLDAKLRSGELSISLRGVNEVKETLEISQNASKILLDFLP
ncbi:hypothetical protein DL96DRAFT_1470873 [Flagelloscypha sp. PMI_526]|nr:hypothetical protein DL96DRAFT_1470873 [Flagelloscypha sp. PMI_526]